MISDPDFVFWDPKSVNFDPPGDKSSKKKVAECRGFNRTFFPGGSKLEPPLENVTFDPDFDLGTMISTPRS